MAGNVKPARHFAFLDGLRGLLALYVLASHVIACDLHEMSGGFRLAVRGFRYGHLAVGGFIVLSGFSLMLPVAATPALRLRDGLAGYLRRRARRILPAYLAALGFAVVVLAGIAWVDPARRADIAEEMSFVSIASHVLLVHTWVPGRAEAINGAFWSIATEWQIYFVFPLLLLPTLRRFGGPAMLLVAFAVGAFPQVALPGSAILAGCPWYLGLFALGMTAAMVCSSPDFSPRAVLRRLPPFAAAGLAAFAAARAAGRSPLLARVVGPDMLSDIADGCLWTCFVLYCACRERLAHDLEPGSVRSTVLRFLESPAMIALGGFSYSLYAIHTPMLRAISCASGVMHLPPLGDFLLRAMVGVPASLVFASLFARWFERPFQMSRHATARTPTPDRGREGGVLKALG